MEIKNSLTIGQYVPTGSLIHKLDPRTKLILVLLFMVMVFLVKSILGYILLFLFILILIIMSKVQIKYFIRGLKPILILIVFTVILQLFFTKGSPVLTLGPLVITKEGVYLAVFILLRLVLLVFSSSLLTLTTSPMELTNALEYVLTPFKFIGLPSGEISMMMTIALRFIPTILEETDRLIKAQSARGVDFESGGLFSKIKNMIPILVPLFISAFRRADDLAIAMEARCFQVGAKRTHLKELKFGILDYIFALIFISVVTTISLLY